MINNTTIQNSHLPKQPTAYLDENEPVWHYKDPQGQVQGPFSTIQIICWKKHG